MHSRPSHQKAQTNTFSQLRMYVRCAFIALSLLALLICQAAVAEENLYAKHYRAQNSNDLKSMQVNPDTQIFVSHHADDDNLSMLEKGYDLMGSSGFEGGDVSPQQALTHGKAIKADVVLVYSKYGSAKTADNRLGQLRDAVKKGTELTEADLQEGPTTYKYFASYWAKLPPPTLGVHVIKLKPKEANASKPLDSHGIKILAVIKDSPAAMAGIQRGDNLIAINNSPVNEPEDLFRLVKQFKGTAVTVDVVRDEQPQPLRVQLR